MSSNVQRLSFGEYQPSGWEIVDTLSSNAEGEDIVWSMWKHIAVLLGKTERYWINDPIRTQAKKLPFPNKFETFVITDPYQVYEAFDHAAANPDLYHTIVIDSLTFLMDMFESLYVLTAADTRTAWGGYQQFFKTLMQDKVAKAEVDVIFTAHTLAQYNEEQMVMENKVPVKGSLKSNGIEALEISAIAA